MKLIDWCFPPSRVLKHRPKFVEEMEQPDFLGEGDLLLRDYQLQGLNWLIHAWTRYVAPLPLPLLHMKC
jgi:hypothetical protein